MAKSSGGGGSTSTTQQSEPWSGVQPYLKNIYSEAQNLYNQSGPNLYPGGWTAPRNPLINESENRALGYSESPRVANMQSGAESMLTGEMLSNPWANPTYGTLRSMMPVGNLALTGSLMNTMMPGMADPAMGQMLSGDPFQNPYTQQVADTNARVMTENFNKHVLPSLRSNITAYNPGGSSRGDIAQGLAVEGLSDAIADNTTQMYQNDYNLALQRQMAAAGLAEQSRSSRAGEGLAQAQGIWAPAIAAENSINQRGAIGMGAYPSLMSAPLSMYQLAQDVGLARRDEAQRAIDEARSKYEYNQNLPYQKLAQYAGLITPGAGYGSTTNTTQTARGGSGGGAGGFFGGALGGAGTGLGLAGTLGEAGLLAAGSSLWPWGVAGGLLGGLGGLF